MGYVVIGMGVIKGGVLISGLLGMIIGGVIGFVGRVVGLIVFDVIEIIKRKLLIL